MKLVTSKQALVECLGIVNKAVSSRSSIQVLSGVLIDAEPRGHRLCRPPTWRSPSKRPSPAGWSSRARWWCRRASPPTSPGACPSGEVIIEQRAGETQVEIRAGESLFNLHSLPAVDFPQLPAPVG